MRSFVAIHLVADASSDPPGGLLALAAARFEEGQPADTLDLRARPAAEPADWVLRGAGLEAKDLEDAPPPAAAMRALREFAGSLPLVASRGESDAEVLRSLGVLSRRSAHQASFPLADQGTDRLGPLMDLGLLARVVFPVLDSHEPAALARHLGLAPAPGPAPLDQAELAARVWMGLLDALEQLPWLVLHQAAELLEGTGMPLAEVFRQAENAALPRAFGSRARSYEDLARDFRSEMRSQAPESEEQSASAQEEEDVGDGGPHPIAPESVSAVFRESGLLHAALPGYERREEQERMALAVAEAFNGERILLAEAGTGVGKSMAYLAPAVLWARRNHERVVVSTNTKNLQDQLYSKDLPLLARALDIRFETAVVKGRSNYLCTRRFLRLLREAESELSPAERVALLPLVVWFPETETGDVAENVGFGASYLPGLWARVSTRGDECVGGRCAKARNCFVRLARARAMGADVIVVNHAVVFSEMGLDSPVLPPYSRIVFDEAHNIENIATEHFAREVSSARVARIQARLQGTRRGSRPGGLLAGLRFAVKGARKTRGEELLRGLLDHADACAGEAGDLGHAMNALEDAAALAFGASPADRVRYASRRLPRQWPEVCEAAEAVRAAGGALAKRLLMMANALQTLGRDVPDGDVLAAEVSSVAGNLGGLVEDLGFCMAAEDPDFVFWAERERAGRGRWALCAAPIEVGPFLREAVYEQKRTVLFSSATLTVGGTFRFMRERLGLAEEDEERLSEIAVGTSFDFERQAMLGVMRFLPPPNEEPAFTQGFVSAAAELLRSARGRALVLFTSHRMLREAQPKLKRALEPEGIRVLAQGVDGDRSLLARVFQEDVSSVLLGAASFWEGVDVVGESLSCLVVARLPFQVHTDPIVEARCERIEARGGSAFFAYSAPSAAIRLKQGFGRLIRSRGDRGAVLIGDRRIVTRPYGRLFLKSLPVAAKAFGDAETMAKAVAAFLDEGAVEQAGPVRPA